MNEFDTHDGSDSGKSFWEKAKAKLTPFEPSIGSKAGNII